MLIGMPLQITICTNKPTAGLVSFSLTFPTVHVNGLTGRLTYPLMARARAQAVRRACLSHVRAALPRRHPLRRKGWCALPLTVEALPLSVAIPA